jgi:hypothetical protein
VHRFSTDSAAIVEAMSETQPIGPPPQEPVLEQPVQEQVDVPASERPRFRDRLFGLWTLIGVAVAALLLGAVAATGVGALVDHDHGRPGQFGPGPDRGGFDGPGHEHGMRGGPDSP